MEATPSLPDESPEERSHRERRERLLSHAQDLHAIFDSPVGQRVKAEWRKTADRQSHVPGDPYATAFRDGERSFILKVFQLLRLYEEKPDTIGQVITEATTE